MTNFDNNFVRIVVSVSKFDNCLVLPNRTTYIVNFSAQLVKRVVDCLCAQTLIARQCLIKRTIHNLNSVSHLVCFNNKSGSSQTNSLLIAMTIMHTPGLVVDTIDQGKNHCLCKSDPSSATFTLCCVFTHRNRSIIHNIVWMLYHSAIIGHSILL